MMAAVHMCVPNLDDEKTLIVAPKSVLNMWDFEIRVKRTAYWDKKTVLLADHQKKLTMDAIQAAKVIIVSPSVLTQAYMTFMFLNKQGIQYTTLNGKTKYLPEFQRGVDPKYTKRVLKFAGRLPPVHPLFQFILDRKAQEKHAFTLAIVDEIHMCSKPTTWAGHTTKLLCAEACYTVGLTGTPVRSRPKQMAWIMGTLNVQPAWLAEPKFYVIRGGGEACIRKSTVTAAHEHVDRVDGSVVDLVEKTHVRIEYDPFVGIKPDGTFNKSQIERHDSFLLRAQRAAMETAQHGAFRKSHDDYVWSAITTMTQFTFDSTLGSYSAEAFNNQPKLYYRLAKKQPSETVKLIWRMLRHRQMAGKRRIVVYSASSVMLKIARNYMAITGGCGRLFLFDGSLDNNERDATIRAFLSDDNPQGVMFMSSAGSVGTTLCPGCETLFVIGDVPWNNSDLDQAYARVHRISQDKPVEIVTFVPRRSVTEAKLKSHEDKRDRLEPAMRDEDFSNFSDTEESQWKLRAQITMGLSTLDATGNYKMTAEQLQVQIAWQNACLAADAAGVPRPPTPPEIQLPTALRADDVVLPPVSYPVEGFVEPTTSSAAIPNHLDSDSDSDSDSDDLDVSAKTLGKRRLIDTDASADALTKEARLALLRELAGADADSSSEEEYDTEDEYESGVDETEDSDDNSDSD